MKQRVSVVLAVLSLAVGLGVASPLRAEAAKPVAPSQLILSMDAVPGSSTYTNITETDISAGFSYLVAAAFTVGADGTVLADVTSRTSWSSSNPAVASVDDKGQGQGVITTTSGVTGTVVITATYKNVKASYLLHVN